MSKQKEERKKRLAYVFERTERVVIAADSYDQAFNTLVNPSLCSNGKHIVISLVKIEFEEALPQSVFTTIER